MLRSIYMSNFGISFKTKRESMGLTLAQIASETRIGTRFLDAIEREDFQILPGGIFSRGFIKSYAEKLGMDPEQAVAEFDRRVNYKEPPVIDTLRVSTPPPEKSNRALYPILIGGLLILVVAGYFVVRQFNKPAATIQPVTLPQAPAASAPAPAVVPTASPVETPAASAETPPPQAQPPVPAVDTTSSAAAPLPPAPAPAAATTPPPAPTPVLETNDVLTLVVGATEVTWVKILGDKYVLLNETLQPGTTRRFTARKSLGIITGNAGGLSLKLNDRDMAPLGKSGQIRIVTITPENLKKFIP
jgi:cytoskeleton protein RodZ